MEGLSLCELIEFYDARDLFFGRGNYRNKQRIQEGFRCLQKSHHPEARYACSLFHHERIQGIGHAEMVLEASATESDNPISLCYAGLVGAINPTLVRKAAEKGHPYAMAHMYTIEWSEKAAKAGDRFALGWLGDHLWYRVKDYPRALAAFKEAAQLGDVHGMNAYGTHAFAKDQVERYMWLGKAASINGDWHVLLQWTETALKRYKDGTCGKLDTIIMCGRVVNKYLITVSSDDRHIAREVASLYRKCMRMAQTATRCWLLCAKQCGLYKDVAQLVARMVWADRDTFLE